MFVNKNIKPVMITSLFYFTKSIVARSISDINEEENENKNTFFSSTFSVICIGSVFAIVLAVGGFCIFSNKKKNMNGNLTNSNSSSTQSSKAILYHPSTAHHDSQSSSVSSSSILDYEKKGKSSENALPTPPSTDEENDIKLNVAEEEEEGKESRIAQVRIKEEDASSHERNIKKKSSSSLESENNNKRKSILSLISHHSSTKNQVNGDVEEVDPPKKHGSRIMRTLSRKNKKNHKKHTSYNLQITDDRSSISTNEDWIYEQKYRDELRRETERRERSTSDNLNDQEDNYEEEIEVENADSYDGFWSTELEPIQSSTNTNPRNSYAIPSLGRKSTMIIRSSTDKEDKSNDVNKNGTIKKHQSVIIMDDDLDALNNSNGNDNNNGEQPTRRPTRLKSWKDNNLDKEILEIIRKLDDEDRKREEAEALAAANDKTTDAENPIIEEN